MAKQRNYRTLDQADEEYYRAHPDEIDSYLTTAFEEYAIDGDTLAMLSSLRMIARVKGVSVVAYESGLTHNSVQKALSEQAQLGFETINVILHAMGYGIALQKLDTHA